MTGLTKGGTVDYAVLGWFRFLLAAMVALGHARGIFDVFGRWFNPGSVAVFMFFTVSGYVVVAALESFYARRYVQFLANRLLRLYPTYMLSYLASVLVLLALGVTTLHPWPVQNISVAGLDVATFLAGLSLLGGYFDADAFNPNSPAWSIVVEVVFYLLAGGWLLAMPRVPVAKALSILAVLTLALFVANVFFGIRSGTANIFLFSPFFILGGSIYRLASGAGRLGATILALAGFVFAQVYILRVDGYTITGFLAAPDAVGNGIVFSILFAIFLFGLRLKVGKTLRAIDKVVGNLTYPLYLVHVPLLAVLWSVFEPRTGLLWLGLSFTLCTLAAYLLHLIAEVPFESMRERNRGASLND